ncbi:MAG: S49 family peptidase [Gemmobacter sp.]
MRMALPFMPKPTFVPVIRLSGTIAAGRGGLGGTPLSDAGLATLIERAFYRGRAAAVALIVNSPGGSPVQSSLIGARIRRLADEHKTPVHCFVEDVAASGGYWLACAGDDIWVDDCSIVGSIGVIFASFGFPELMKRQGIERRVVTAGRSKSLADPFLPEKPEDVERLRALQAPIHQAFIEHVKARRGARLDATADLFNADVWVGQDAVKVGLADGVAHVVPKLKALYGDKVRLVPMGQRRSLLQRLGGASLGADVGVGLTRAALTEVEDRAAWARFGL